MQTKKINEYLLIMLHIICFSCRHKNENNIETHYYNFKILISTVNPFFGIESKYIISNQQQFDKSNSGGKLCLINYVISSDRNKKLHHITEPGDTVSTQLQQNQIDSLYILTSNILKKIETKHDHIQVPAPPLPGDGKSIILCLEKSKRTYTVNIGDKDADDISELLIYLKSIP